MFYFPRLIKQLYPKSLSYWIGIFFSGLIKQCSSFTLLLDLIILDSTPFLPYNQALYDSALFLPYNKALLGSLLLFKPYQVALFGQNSLFKPYQVIFSLCFIIISHSLILFFSCLIIQCFVNYNQALLGSFSFPKLYQITFSFHRTIGPY